MPTPIQIAAARRFAPPLVTLGQIDRRGARLRAVNRRAVDYASRAGMTLEDVYPGGGAAVREMAPPEGSVEAAAFLGAAGLRRQDVYFAGELSPAPSKPWRWGWVAVGALVGAVIAGPLGAAVGGLIGASR